MNSILMECFKSPAPYFWPILHSRDIVPPRTPKVWWEMLSKYGNELRKVIDLLEIGDMDREISSKVRSKSKNKRKKELGEKNGHFGCRQGSP